MLIRKDRPVYNLPAAPSSGLTSVDSSQASRGNNIYNDFLLTWDYLSEETRHQLERKLPSLVRQKLSPLKIYYNKNTRQTAIHIESEFGFNREYFQPGLKRKGHGAIQVVSCGATRNWVLSVGYYKIEKLLTDFFKREGDDITVVGPDAYEFYQKWKEENKILKT